jgi:methylated-DNA-[protein]-cysteine S-methyltransferase
VPASTFTTRVLALTRMIPPGRVATYGDIAAWAGRPLAHRAVGTIMRTTGVAGVPYHRVVAAGGALGGYGGQEATKRRLLQLEGLVIVGTRIRAFADVRWQGPSRRSPRRTRTGVDPS